MKRASLIVFGILAMLALPVGAQQKPGESVREVAAAVPASSGDVTDAVASDNPVLKSRYPRYQVQAGDILQVDFSYTPDYNQVVTVQPDGYISLRDVGDTHVEGKTVPEMIQTLRDAYAKILNDPAISVVLKNFELPYFVVGGRVQRPGKYELRTDTTLTEGISMAGGFTDASKLSEVLLFRRGANNWVDVKKFNVKKMINSRDAAEDVRLQPGDMIIVPQNILSKIKGFVIPRATIGPVYEPHPNAP